MMRTSKERLFAALPPPWPDNLRPQIRAAVAANPGHKLVVLDDATGTQSVHDAPVLTTWDVAMLRAEFHGPHPCFYVLTNWRDLPADEARALVLTLARNIREAAGLRPCTLVWRVDSTLHGHFPLETDALAEVFGTFDATFLIPYCEGAGYYTINDVHYVAEGDALVPVHTLSARAAVESRNSNRRAFVAEKSTGRITTDDVWSVTLAELRQGGPEAVTRKLLALPHGAVCIVNAAAPTDLDVFVTGVLAAEAQSRRDCFCAAAQFPAARLGLESQPLLTARALELFRAPRPQPLKRDPSREHEVPKPVFPPPEPHRGKSLLPLEEDEHRASWPTETADTGGLVIVGSHRPRTTRQLARLPVAADLLCVELRVEQLLSARRREMLARVSATVAATLRSGKDVVVFTSRQFVAGGNAAASLHISSRIADALAELVRELEVCPRYLIAKGGFTASDIAARALGAGRAMVLGQIWPGVPVWRLGLEARFPGVPYIVFPGHVGGPEALAEVVKKLGTDDSAAG